MNNEVISTSEFRKDLRRLQKRKYDMSQLDHVVELLICNKKLPLKNHDHKLQGKYANHRECHIAPDWLLIYRLYKKRATLELTRTGTHSDLF